jgi:hypothetical protein
VTTEEFAHALKTAVPVLPPLIVSIRDVEEETLRELFPEEEGGAGFHMPWTPDDPSADFKLMRGHLSIIGGLDKSGKSIIAQNIALYQASVGHKVAIASMEFQPHETFAWLAECATAKPNFRMTRYEAKNCFSWFDDSVFLVKADDGFTVSQCVETFEWLRAVKGVTYFLADSLTTFDDVDETEPKQQIKAIKTLTKLPRRLDAHMQLVAHFKKAMTLKNGQKEEQDRSAIRGASAIKDIAQTVMLVRRDWEKRKAIREVLKTMPPGEERKIVLHDIWSNCENPDVTVSVDAHRKTGADPEYHLWWHACRQYTSKPDESLLIPYYLHAH